MKGMTREDLLASKPGEVIRYSQGYIIISSIDTTRGRVCGTLVGEFYGVNSLPFEDLEEGAERITRRVEGVNSPLGDARFEKK